MSSPYIPAQDSAYDNWANNFQATIAASPVTYGLTTGDATNITTAYNNWHAAYLLGGLTAPPHPVPVNPATRTPITVLQKDTQKTLSLSLFRSYAQVIGANAGITGAAKTAAGLTDRSITRTPIPAPSTAPVLGFIGATPLQHTLKYSDITSPTTKAKPFGSIGMELWMTIGTVPPISKEVLSFYGIITKSPFAVNFVDADVGKNAYYFSRWNNRKGEVGPWSTLLVAAIV